MYRKSTSCWEKVQVSLIVGAKLLRWLRKVWRPVEVSCQMKRVSSINLLYHIIMPNYTDIIYVYSHRKCTLSRSLPTILIFFHRTPLSHSAFSMSKGTVITDTISTTHGHMINPFFHAYRKYLSLSRAASHSYLWHSCNTYLDNSWYFSVRVK